MSDRIEAGGRFRVRDDLAVLDVLSSDLSQGTGLGAIVRDELGSDGERLGSVDGTTRRPVVGQALRVRIETTAAFVAVGGTAGVGSVGVGHGVSLEDIHLIAAVSLVTGVQRAILPGLDRALGIAVSRAILSATCVILISSTGGAHLGQVKSTVFTAGQSRHIDVEAQFTTEELHHHVVTIRTEEVESWRSIAVCAVALNVLVHGQRAPGRSHTSGGIVGSFNNTVLGTGCFIGAQGCVDTRGSRA